MSQTPLGVPTDGSVLKGPDGKYVQVPTKLPPFFPMVRPQCKEQSAKFFFCFTENGRQMLEEPEAGQRAIYLCMTQLADYEDCMKNALRK
ncbi:hypothetical protein PROFUN_14901 [Planoprotostelium fungivorum]|uniref:Uncharacterized protein n=1 Tax=Planoprotostelium fungivorum TaxID=1890364 RepID=A0A2P6MY86_9EUKA|nr:hypothetical protein PROFUN_14901 [Planoprotostelium fungivorum]